MTVNERTRGAALVIAIAIMTVLLVIALVFFTLARAELRSATNTTNAYRADLIADGALAIATAVLQHDAVIHSTYTSLDHAWRVYFNGAWAVGKDWAWKTYDPTTGKPLPVALGGQPIPLLDADGERGVPEINLPEIEQAIPGLYGNKDSADWMYIPRTQSSANLSPQAFGPFAVSADYGYSPLAVQLGIAPDALKNDVYDSNGNKRTLDFARALLPSEQIHFWTDVDNDGDGLRDSIWIPIPADRFFGSSDADHPGDGIDNDLDFTTDPKMIDEADETAPFVYRDETTGRYYLTAPILAPDPANPSQLASRIEIANTLSPTIVLDPRPGSPDVDEIDNDYSLVVNDHEEYIYRYFPKIGVTPQDPLNPTEGEIDQVFVDSNLDSQGRSIGSGLVNLSTQGSIKDVLERRFHPIAQLSRDYGDGSIMVVTSTGEPVCEVAGRAAILITDEAAKVNLNAAGGHTYKQTWKGALEPNGPVVQRALDQGATPFEYETRVLPDIGTAFSDHLWSMLTGADDATAGTGIGFVSDPPASQLSPIGDLYHWDEGFPGYGRVDDNGDALSLAMNGIDDDGNGFIDDGVILYDYGDGLGVRYGQLEGVDEPGEFRLYRPLRNRLAESDAPLDNNGNNVVDELGEFGDRGLKTLEQMKLVKGFPGKTFDKLQNVTTVHSTDKNERHLLADPLGNALNDPSDRTVTGLKLDYNYARPADITNALVGDWGYPDLQTFLDKLQALINQGAPLPAYLQALYAVSGGSPSLPTPAQTHFALGLRREDMSIVAPYGILGDSGVAVTGFPADARLRAGQLAVNIKDNRDADSARSQVTSAESDPWWQSPDVSQKWLGYPGELRSIQYTQAGVESIRINEIMVRPVRRVEAEMDREPPPALGGTGDRQFYPNYFSSAIGASFADFNMVASVLKEDDLQALSSSSWGDLGAAGVPIRKSDPARPYIGPGTAYVSPATGVGSSTAVLLPPDVPAEDTIQFRFAPSPGLPAGRYYLIVNTADVDPDGTPTVTGIDQMQYAIKYGDTANDILGDELSNPANVQWQSLSAGAIGREPNNNPTGQVFLANKNVDPPPVPPALPAGYAGGWGFTVEVPPYDPANQVYLYVAISKPITSLGTPKLSINFFDFSQEPDHEWVEVVNIAEGGQPVDMSGWQLEVGVNPRKLLTVPDQTFIAPGGSLLLGLDKFDRFEDATYDPLVPGNNYIQANGIGLARGAIQTDPPALGAIFQNVTEPPIPNPFLEPQAGPSAFDRRGNYTDLVDYNGDSSADPNAPDNTLRSTLDPMGPELPNKAWDRIVQLQTDFFDSATDVDGVAQIVLGGGIFPDYPEHDGYDNDGDNATLTSDGVDNNGDGQVDEDNEGYDEGRWDLAPAGLPGLTPRYFAPPGSFSADTIPYVVGPTHLVAQPPSTLADSTAFPLQQPYQGSRPDPPDWKEFAERRWYPGDNVVITLYQGSAAFNRVVDRVTYTERDVVNRDIDDQIDCPYLAAAGVRAGLNPDYPTFWPDNTMGVDFYRSIERKHPLYNGDRFGTTNRWLATDGAYDDWAPSTSRMERVVNAAGQSVAMVDRNVAAPLLFDHAFSGSPLRMNLSQRYIENPLVDGSPVNREFANDGDGATFVNEKGWAFSRARIRNHSYVSSGDLMTLSNYADQHVMLAGSGNAATAFLYDDTPVNRSLEGGYRQDLIVWGKDTPAEVQDGVQGVVLGQHYVNDLRAVMSANMNSSLVLTAAQATAGPRPPIAPDNWAATGDALSQDWRPVYLYTVGLKDTTPDPAEPLLITDPLHYLFKTPDYLLQRPPYDPTNADLLAYRWPLYAPVQSNQVWGDVSRVVCYVSGNFLTFKPSSLRPTQFSAPVNAGAPPSGAEISFEWDGDDGLENGEYDVSVATVDDLGELAASNAASSGGLLTDFGRDFVALAQSVDPKKMPVDLEFRTDRNGDRLLNNPDESCGTINGVVPDDDGIIHYGVIRIENNRLGLNLRNWSERGHLNRFSRVILTPRQRTAGRVNINTAETHIVPDGAQHVAFNPLMGVPGLLLEYDPTTGAWKYPAESDAIGLPTSLIDPTLANTAYTSYNVLWEMMDRARTIDGSGWGPPPVSPLTTQEWRGRPEWIDGRYYRDPSDLISFTDGLGQPWYYTPTLSTVGLAPTPPRPAGSSVSAGDWDTFWAQQWVGRRFDELQFRYGRMANLATTRSDVFEIIVTAQSGYLSNSDVNGDGRIDYRNDFVVTGEKKVRTIYER